jgi:penicillin-binding protein 1B
MTIEVTSVSEGWALNPRKLARSFRFLIRALASVVLLAIILAAFSLVRSYKYYAGIVDARLAQGYLTSRPGLYAAPTTIRTGQALSADNLVMKLRRAGYLESQSSDAWSGSFTRRGDVIEIRSTPTIGSPARAPVQVAFQNSKIQDLTVDGISVDSFTLEPEVLTNDVLIKPGERHALSFGELPPVLVQAILATEDRRFFQHPGLDPFGVIRAFLRNAGSDHIGQGGSTITQQLVKNTYLSSERTFRRKYAEAMLALALEHRLSKQDIFALYCNEIYLGQRGAMAIRGVEQAAKAYFGKEPKQLSLAEAATIAGIIQGPGRYSPVRSASAAIERRNAVLQSMLHEGWINNDQAASASKEELVLAPAQEGNSLAPYFIDYVNRVAETKSMSGDNQRVYTTIDLDLQELAEAALKRQVDLLDKRYEKTNSRPQAALVALDPHTGNVLAMVGGRDYAASQLNRATDAQRQPGSTFKPFVYAAALEDGMSPVTMFTDAPQEFVFDRNKIYRPANYGGGYSMRNVTMRSALVNSLNTVTVAIAMQIGLARTANLAQQFGLPRPERYPSLALGTSLATPLQLASAYAAFVNGGKKVEPQVITGVSELRTEAVTDAPQQVIDPTTAYMITNMLSAAIDHGTARAARGAIKGTAIAGKTGTSRDGWFVGYTPNLVCVVWIGFDDNKQLGLTGAAAALPAWTDFMKAAIARRPELGGKNFLCPEGIKFVEIDNNTGLISTLTCPNRELIAVTERLAPYSECYLHGNLPGPAREEIAAPSFSFEVARRPPPQPDPFVFLPGATRVEIDPNGRRTLVNDMR